MSVGGGTESKLSSNGLKTTAARREIGARAVEKSKDSRHLIRHYQTAKGPPRWRAFLA
jgi:hypothetical protein